MGAYSGGSGDGTSTGALTSDASTGSSGGSTSDTGVEEPASGFDGSTCESVDDCTPRSSCQQAQCMEGRCLFEFHDELCEAGSMCTLGGCVPASSACEDRYEGVLVCDDFEQGISPQWTIISVVTETDQVSGGGVSVRASTVPDEQAMLRFAFDQPLFDGMLAVRSYLWVEDSSVVDPWGIHYELMQIPSHPDMRISLDLRPEGGLIMVNKIADTAEVDQGLIASGQWYCVELRVGIDDVAGTTEVRLNDQPVLVDEPGDTRPVEGFRQIGIGVLLPAQGMGPVEVLMDDLVVATSPIGCD